MQIVFPLFLLDEGQVKTSVSEVRLLFGAIGDLALIGFGGRELEILQVLDVAEDAVGGHIHDELVVVIGGLGVDQAVELRLRPSLDAPLFNVVLLKLLYVLLVVVLDSLLVRGKVLKRVVLSRSGVSERVHEEQDGEDHEHDEGCRVPSDVFSGRIEGRLNGVTGETDVSA